jgi:hypothetical protein
MVHLAPPVDLSASIIVALSPVRVNYTAKLASTGAVFDSTYQRRQPLIFKVSIYLNLVSVSLGGSGGGYT